VPSGGEDELTIDLVMQRDDARLATTAPPR
jgi:hypothetical protein